jgi:hypothetical protein
MSTIRNKYPKPVRINVDLADKISAYLVVCATAHEEIAYNAVSEPLRDALADYIAARARRDAIHSWFALDEYLERIAETNGKDTSVSDVLWEAQRIAASLRKGGHRA